MLSWLGGDTLTLINGKPALEKLALGQLYCNYGCGPLSGKDTPVKFGELRSIAHNVAASLASGCGLLVGIYNMDIFGEAACNPEGFIAVDFLTGTTSGGIPSADLAFAIGLYPDGLHALCLKHNTSPRVFKQLTARYTAAPFGGRFLVSVADHRGHTAVDEYLGVRGNRTRVLDSLGRVRPSSVHKIA